MSSNLSDATAHRQAKEHYMQSFTGLFESELVEIYEADSSGEALQQLKLCIEAGVAIWGYPLAVGDPMRDLSS